MKTYWGSGDIAPRILILGGEWSNSRPGRFTPGRRARGTHRIGSCVGPRADLDEMVKRKIPRPCRDSTYRSCSPSPSAIPLDVNYVYAASLCCAGSSFCNVTKIVSTLYNCVVRVVGLIFLLRFLQLLGKDYTLCVVFDQETRLQRRLGWVTVLNIVYVYCTSLKNDPT